MRSMACACTMHPRGTRYCRLAVPDIGATANGLIWCLFTLVALLYPAPLLNGQDLDESAIKVAYIFNLTKYVEWPHAGNQLVVGFVGDGPMGEALEKMLNGKTSGSKVIQVVRSPKPLEQCDVVYVAYTSPKKIHATLDQLHDKSVLTVGDTEAFPKEGGMVGLVRAGPQVRIEVNLDAVQRARLTISSQVLRLATIVRGAPEARN